MAALNQHAREWMETSGRLNGPELVCAGGNRYRAGDQVVTLAPGLDGTLVTSQRAVIKAVDPGQRILRLRTDNGQTVQLDTEEAGSDRLGYGYATTVHRAQGATVERAHLFADGGGRELAYVALSRARQATQVWAVADDLPQSVEDLRRDWATRRTPAWAIDTALPDPATLDRQRYQALSQEHQARYAAVIHAEKTIASQAVVGINLPDRTATLGQAEQALHAARQARADLDRGTGLWADTDPGRAVRDLTEVRAARERAEHIAEQGARWRDRHAASKQAKQWDRREGDAQQRWDTLVAPRIDCLDQEIARHQATLDHASARFERRKASTGAVIDHGRQHQRQVWALAGRLDHRRAEIDGLPSRVDTSQSAARYRHDHLVATTAEHQPVLAVPPSIEL